MRLNAQRTAPRRAIKRPAAAELDSAVPDEVTLPLEAAIGRETLERYEKRSSVSTWTSGRPSSHASSFGFSYAEVAEALGKPSADAARMAVVRALVKLAKEMDGNV